MFRHRVAGLDTGAGLGEVFALSAQRARRGDSGPFPIVAPRQHALFMKRMAARGRFDGAAFHHLVAANGALRGGGFQQGDLGTSRLDPGLQPGLGLGRSQGLFQAPPS